MPTIDEIMNDVQTFASNWSIAGGKFDDGNAIEVAEEYRKAIRAAIESAIAAAVAAEREPLPIGEVFAWARVCNISGRVHGVFEPGPDGSAPDVELRSESMRPLVFAEQPKPLIAQETPDAGTIYRMGERIAELEAQLSSVKRTNEMWLSHMSKLGAERDALKVNDARYRWLRTRILAADFEWGEKKQPVLVFDWPATVGIGGNLDMNVDAAMNQPKEGQ